VIPTLELTDYFCTTIVVIKEESATAFYISPPSAEPKAHLESAWHLFFAFFSPCHTRRTTPPFTLNHGAKTWIWFCKTS
jgi:hypothetical protein